MRRAVLQVYRDMTGEFRWRLKAANGRTIADSGESYTRRRDAQRAGRMVAVAAATAKVEQL